MTPRVVSLLACALLLLGCPSGTPEGANTPRDAFDAYKRAALTKDWAAVYAATDPQERTEILVNAQMNAEHRAKKPEQRAAFREIKAKHQVGEWSGTRGTLIKDEIYQQVADPQALFAEFCTFHPSPNPTPEWERWGQLAAEFTVEGDVARGLMVRYPDEVERPEGFYDMSGEEQAYVDQALQGQRDYRAGKRHETEVVFVRRDGRWYFQDYGDYHFTEYDEDE